MRSKLTLMMVFIMFSLLVLADSIFAETIEIEMAKGAAAEMLPQFYEGDWVYYTNFAYFDLDGQVTAYAIVFAKAGADVKSVKEVAKAIPKIRQEIEELKGKSKEIVDQEDISGKLKNDKLAVISEKIRKKQQEIVGTENFATVITGAQDFWPVVLKCHLGLPSAFVQEDDTTAYMNNAHGNKAWKIKKYLYLNPFETNYEISDSATGSETQGDDDAIVVEIGSRKSMNKKELKEKQKAQDAAQLQQTASGGVSGDDEEVKRKENNKAMWDRYKKVSAFKKQENDIKPSSSLPMEAPVETNTQTNQPDAVVINEGDFRVNDVENR